MKIEKDAIHNFVAATARKWKLDTRVSLNNKTGEDLFVNARVRNQGGGFLRSAQDIGRIQAGAAGNFDLQSLAHSLGVVASPLDQEELVFVFSLVPERFRREKGLVEIDPKEVFRLNGCQDHYIEHYDPETGLASGVLYQVPPMNDSRFSPHGSLLMQAPKVLLGDWENTFFRLYFFSSQPHLNREALLRCVLRNEQGVPLLSWEEPIHSHGLLDLDIKETIRSRGLKLDRAIGVTTFLYFQAFCPDASMICLTFLFRDSDRTFCLEHSLPPVYYDPEIRGNRKNAIIRHLMETWPPEPGDLSAPLVASSNWKKEKGT